MASAVKIFISASSSDLRTFRNQVKTWLLDMGWLPVVQDHFAPDDQTVVEMLKKRISECDAVIHIIGQSYGAEPQAPLKGEFRRSFTQLEAVFARKMRKRLFTLLLDENFPYDAHAPEPPDLRVLQQAYRLQVATGPHLYIPGRSPDQLEPEIRKLRVEIDKLNKSRRTVLLLATIPVFLMLVAGISIWYSQRAIRSDTAAIKQGQEQAAEQQKKLATLVVDAAGSGAPSVKAISDIRDLLRPGNPDIDMIPAEKLPGLVKQILDDLPKTAAQAVDFSGTVKRVLTEAQARTAELKFSDAARELDAALARTDLEDAERSRGKAALLAERGRVAKFQWHYREAAGFYQKAATALAGDPQAARNYALAAAESLYLQGDEFGDNPALSEAIQAYRSLLATTPVAQTSLDWAAIENDLGNVQLRLGARETETTRLEDAVVSYTEALKVRTREHTPLDWATTESNLGAALQELGEREAGTARLEAAVAAYSEVLKVRTREREPLDWATTENNLGLALDRLGERETGTAKLEDAVTAFQEALKERTRNRSPLDWAATENNLGLALEALGERDTGSEKLEAAVTAYNEALKENTRERVPLDWAMTKNNLGNALETLGERETPGTARLEAAIAAYNEALEKYTREEAPLDWAMTQDNLGNALRMLGEREAGAEGLKAAIAAYAESLKVRTRDVVPLDWAASTGDQGIALMLLAKKTNDPDTAKTAVEQIEAAYVTAVRGGDSSSAANFEKHLPEARTLLEQLTKH